MVAVIGIIGIMGAAYIVKDESGVSYLEKGYAMIKHYTVDRNVDAIKQANDVKATAQLQQDRLQLELDTQ